MLLDPDSFHSLEEHVAENPSARVSVLVDPDLPGAGEDHFAASLEAKAPPENDDDLLDLDDDAGGQFLGGQFLGGSARDGLIGGIAGGTNGGTREESSLADEPLADVTTPPTNGANGSASASAPPARRAASKNGSAWREEVANRLDAYRSRRKRRTEQSLSLNFEQADSNSSSDRSASKLIRFPGPGIVGTSVLDQAMAAEPAAAEPEATATTACATASATAAPAVTGTLTAEDLAAVVTASPGEELAEPVEAWVSTATYEPEAPAEPETETTPSLAMTLETLEDEAALEPENARFAEFYSDREFVLELPLQPAPMSQRLLSTAADGGLVFTATLLFATTFFLFTEAAPTLRVVLPILVVVPVAFWCAYQYLFLVLVGATPGMFVAGLELTTFDDGLVDVRTRCWRATATLISCVSLGLGYLWSLVDEDSLTWHDRITRTMVVPERLL
ncbi:MAG: RDD family protein [Acidobacteria bacterium]|nr:RDD family protein [Acidobacteriota bacterium]